MWYRGGGAGSGLGAGPPSSRRPSRKLSSAAIPAAPGRAAGRGGGAAAAAGEAGGWRGARMAAEHVWLRLFSCTTERKLGSCDDGGSFTGDPRAWCFSEFLWFAQFFENAHDCLAAFWAGQQ